MLLTNPYALITGKQAAEQAGVRPGTIRQWVNRGLLAPAGRTADGHNLYRLLDVARAELSTRDRARRTPRHATPASSH